ncbi:MAG TPA: NAD(+) diphosphatase [Anaeromyxobacter sp.]|nr:NAD(+) diphosphatase [Anaeromyxobacter sp.]
MLLPDSFVPLWSPPAGDLPLGFWFVFRDRDLLVGAGPSGPTIPRSRPDGGPPLPVTGVRCVGRLGQAPCWAAQATDEALPEGSSLEPIRDLFDRLDDGLLAVAGRAAQVMDFDRTHRYCGACAACTNLADGGRARRCPRCGATFYPRIAPAMMALVTRKGPAGRELLLARGRRFSLPIYSALAGFVEPSETLEESVHREVREEVSIEVRGLRYFASQCWPFPHSLMVAFLAEHAGGEIACDPSEIVDARWFPVDCLPLLPHRLSVARRLIDHAVAEAASLGAERGPRAGERTEAG